MSIERIDELNEEITSLQIDRDTSVDEGDIERVREIDMEIEALTAYLKRLEMLVKKGAV